MFPYLTTKQKNDLMAVRYLDDWVYEANIRQNVRKNLIYKNQWVDGAFTPIQKFEAEQAISKGMTVFASKYMGPYMLKKWNYGLPWNRTFEVNVYKV